MSKSTRRVFFEYLTDEIFAAVDDCRGRPSFKLSELDELADEDIGRLVPALLDVSAVTTSGGEVILTQRSGYHEVLFRKNTFEEETWSRIDGSATIKEIADTMAPLWLVPEQISFTRVRVLFILLVKKQICLPLNPL
ncbi:MAG: hypothetical protein IT367_16445 [Candidatus Hydrogenedentes bacterium]|nr:hypothetical protein [Candidatus Hydrogenedentota bacterium]